MQVLHTAAHWIAFRLTQDHENVHIRANMPLLCPQLKNLGFATDKLTIPFRTILQKIQSLKGQDFVTTNFDSDDNQYKALEAIIGMGTLMPTTIEDEFKSEDFKNLIQKIKKSEYNLSAIATIYGEEGLKKIVTDSISVTIGTFPHAFDPAIVEGHHLYPEKHQLFTQYPAIMLQRKHAYDWMKTSNFDVLFQISMETRIFSEVFRADLNHALKNEQEYKQGKPGCWWIQQSKFMEAAKLKMSQTLTVPMVLEVSSSTIGNFFPYLTLSHQNIFKIYMSKVTLLDRDELKASSPKKSKWVNHSSTTF